MEEKYMVNDILESSKGEIKTYTDAIVETENMELRQAFQNIRSNLESFEYELSRLAVSKGYCNKPQFAKPEEINKLKNTLNNLEGE